MAANSRAVKGPASPKPPVNLPRSIGGFPLCSCRGHNQNLALSVFKTTRFALSASFSSHSPELFYYHAPSPSEATLQGTNARGFQNKRGKLVIHRTELIPRANQFPSLSSKMSALVLPTVAVLHFSLQFCVTDDCLLHYRWCTKDLHLITWNPNSWHEFSQVQHRDAQSICQSIWHAWLALPIHFAIILLDLHWTRQCRQHWCASVHLWFPQWQLSSKNVLIHQKIKKNPTKHINKLPRPWQVLNYLQAL